MPHRVDFEFIHTKGDDPDCQELCEDLITVDLTYEPADREVGIMSGGWMLDWECPDKCTTCGHTYTEEEREEIGNKADKYAEEYDPEPLEPDYDED